MARLQRIMEHALKSEKILWNMIRDATNLKHIHRNFCEIIANPIVVKAREPAKPFSCDQLSSQLTITRRSRRAALD